MAEGHAPILNLEEGPAQLAVLSESGVFVPNEATLSALKACTQRVTIVGITGLYGSGKSSLLNLLAKPKNRGFEGGDSTESTTKGIWVLLTKNPVKTNEKILWIDTEGAGDPMTNKYAENMCLMFCLVVCDFLILNVEKRIDKNTLEALSSLGGIANLATVEWKTYLPHLIVALRDFQQKFKIKGKECNSNEYLKNMLQPKDGDSKDVIEFNKIRDFILRHFPQRDLIPFPYPCNQGEIQQVATMKNEWKLVDGFKNKLEFLKDIIVQGRGNLTGQGLAERTPIYLKDMGKAITEIHIPDIIKTTEKSVRSALIKQAANFFQQNLDKKWETYLSDDKKDAAKIADELITEIGITYEKTKEKFLGIVPSAEKKFKVKMQKIVNEKVEKRKSRMIKMLVILGIVTTVGVAGAAASGGVMLGAYLGAATVGGSALAAGAIAGAVGTASGATGVGTGIGIAKQKRYIKITTKLLESYKTVLDDL